MAEKVKNKLSKGQKKVDNFLRPLEVVQLHLDFFKVPPAEQLNQTHATFPNIKIPLTLPAL
jgi:hypothetical protein